jgi:hypothetical protein
MAAVVSTCVLSPFPVALLCHCPPPPHSIDRSVRGGTGRGARWGRSKLLFTAVARALVCTLLPAVAVTVAVVVARLLYVRKWSVLSALSRPELIGYSHSSVLLLSVAHDLYGVWYMVFRLRHTLPIRGTSPCRLSPYTLSFMPGFWCSLIRLSYFCVTTTSPVWLFSNPPFLFAYIFFFFFSCSCLAASLHRQTMVSPVVLHTTMLRVCTEMPGLADRRAPPDTPSGEKKTSVSPH